MKYRGRVISATAPVANNSQASGIWFLPQHMQGVQGTTWPSTSLFTFTTHTFTPASSVGTSGPTLISVQSAYSSQTWSSDPAYFSQGRAQGYQVWTVPQSTIYEIEVAGARGQNSNQGLGIGQGAIVRGRFFLTSGTKLEMVVGQVPGNGGSSNPSNSFSGGGGGSFVCLNGTSTPIIVAGGGGGTYSSLAMGSLSSSFGSTRRRGHVYTGLSPASYSSNPVDGSGGWGYHGGGGGGLLSSGQSYPTSPGSAGMSGTSQQTTHGASFVGGSVDNVAGTWFATGGSATTATSEGGFGGGGGGHSGNNTAGGGGGYTGGMGGQTSLGGSHTSALGGGSFIESTATVVATSDGQYDGSSIFNGVSVANIGTYNNGSGYIKITKV